MNLLNINKKNQLLQRLPTYRNPAGRMSTVSSQQGSALMISLVILITITLAATTAMQRSTLQGRMVGNMQHQQNIFNAAQGDLSSLIDQLRDPDKADRVLNKIIQAEKQTTGSTIEPFELGELVKPTLPQNIKPTSNKLRVFSLSSHAQNSLKATEGFSAGTLTPYHFANKVEVFDTNNNAKSIQEIGFYYLAPATN